MQQQNKPIYLKYKYVTGIDVNRTYHYYNTLLSNNIKYIMFTNSIDHFFFHYSFIFGILYKLNTQIFILCAN